MDKKVFDTTLSLTNKGQLSLFFIGTGSAFSKTYFQTNLLIVKGNQHLLVDCGTLCPYVLDSKYNFKIRSIENLLLTHPHADHIGGVEEMGFVSYYANKAKLNLIITDEFKKKLWNESLKGGMQYSEKRKMSFDDYFIQHKPELISKKPFPIWEIDFNGINIKLFRTHHVSTKKNSFRNSQFSVGLIIDDKVLFTGDSQYRPDQLEWIKKHFPIETIFHDCDIAGYSAGVHATYDDLKNLSEELKSKIYLCHYNHNINSFDAKKDGFAGFAEAGVYYEF